MTSTQLKQRAEMFYDPENRDRRPCEFADCPHPEEK